MKRDPIQGLIVPGVDVASGIAGRSWKIASAALAVSLAWIVACYWNTGASMVGIWARSDTFAHGFVVLPISLWLIWRVRANVLRAVPQPCWWMLIPMAAAGFGWLLGELGTVNALSQFAFVALLVMAVPAVLGIEVARTIAFPLGFLFFAVPVGEFVMPQLMTWTADVTVKALQLTGLPVFREGQNFVIPSGRWSVVEACSGVRYLIASLVIGTLYAYLTYQSLYRRLVFVAFSIAVPIVANWARAYMIVMIGHLSGNKLAVGADHLIYGWVFFGIVILLMFWIGGIWRDDDVVLDGRAPVKPAVAANASAGEFLLVAAMLAVATAVWPLGGHVIERSEPTSTPTLSALPASGGWIPSSGGTSDWQPRFVNPSAELHQTWRRGDATVGVYIAYYRNQDPSRKLVSSENVLVHSSDLKWSKVAGGSRAIAVDGKPVDAATAELLATTGERLVAWDWYWIDGRLTASDMLAKGYAALASLAGRGDDGAIVVVYTPKGRPGEADATLDAFMHDMGPSLAAELGRTRDRR